MIFRTGPHNRWRNRFAFFPVHIGDNELLWLAWYQWRWLGEHKVTFERRAVVNGREILYEDCIGHQL